METKRDISGILPFDERAIDQQSEEFEERVIRASMNMDAAIDAGLPIDAQSRVLSVEFRCGEAVHLHPRIEPMLREGWTLTRAAPKLVDGSVRLIVTMRRPRRALS